MPTERPLDNPPFGQQDKPFDARRTRNNFEIPRRSFACHPRAESMIMVFRIGPHLRQSRKRVGSNLRKELRDGGCVVDRGSGDRHRQQHAQSIHENMAFAASDFFAAVVAPFAAHVCCLDTLAINACGAGGRFTPGCCAYSCPQRVDNTLPSPIDQPPLTVPAVKLLFAAPLGQPLHFVEA
jgi:hypothetical protein